MTEKAGHTTIRPGGGRIGEEALIGHVLDHYRVLEALGAGGMGKVYLAHDEQLGREVALKVLSQEDATEEAVRGRLLHEARLASALNHPNICTIYQVQASGSQPFIAMEYIAGRTLADLLTVGAGLATEQAMAYALQIADALEHAHARNVIHRDLKCANVIVMAGGRVKVLDFGLAKWMEARDLDAVTMSAVSLTCHGAIVGTLPYMSPEILRGEVASTTSDIWAFGVVLYELLAGRLPFQGQSAYDLTTSIMRDEPKPIPHQLPAGLSNVLQRCLSKDPTQRYANGGQLHAALQAAAVGTPAAASVRRISWALLVALLLAATVLAALGIWAMLRFLHGQRGGTDSIAILPFSNRSDGPETEYLSDGLTEGLIDAVSRQPNVRVSPRNTVFTYKGKQVGAGQVGRELGVKAVLTGSVIVQSGTLTVDAELIDTNSLKRLWNGHYSRVLSDSVTLKEELTREITAKVIGEARLESSTATISHPTQSNDAYQAHLKGMYHLYKHTPEELEQARQFFESALAADPTYAPAYAGLSAYYSILADSGLAPPATLLKGKAAAEKALQLDTKMTYAANSLAYIKLVYDWDLRGAEADFRRLIAAQPNAPEYYVEFAICLRTLGRWDEAIASGHKALTLDPLSVETNASYAWNLYFARRFDDAIGQFRGTLVLDPSYAPAHFGLALSFNRKHMEPQAAAEFEKYLAATAGEEIGADFRKKYRQSGYTAALQTLWDLQLTFLKRQAEQEYVSPMLFASTYALLDRKEEAFEWLEKSYQEKSIKLLDLKVDPDFDSLRGDPRFAQLTKRIGLP